MQDLLKKTSLADYNLINITSFKIELYPKKCYFFKVSTMYQNKKHF